MPTQRANSYNTGIAAEHFVLSQLYRRGVEAYMSQGNKKAIDIRIISKSGHPKSVDVKAVRSYSSVPVNNINTAPNHFIAFVIYNNKFEDLTVLPDVFIVPSNEVPNIQRQWQDQKRVLKGNLKPYLNNWKALC